MKNWVKRMLRTFAQSAIGYVAVALPAISFTGEVSAVKTALVGLLMSAIAAGLSAIMNYKEEV